MEPQDWFIYFAPPEGQVSRFSVHLLNARAWWRGFLAQWREVFR